MDRVRRRVEELFGVAATPPIAAVGDRGADRRRGAGVPARGGLPAGAAGDDARAAVAAAPRGVPGRRPSRRSTITGSRTRWSSRTPDGRLAYEPLGTDLVRHANAPILEEDRTLVIDGQEGRCFQALLGLGALPEESEFPGGAELLSAPLEALPFPVDAVLHARWLGNRDAVTAGAPADRRRRRGVQRAADLGARPAVLHGRGEPAARARAGRLPAVARAAAAAQHGDLAGGRRRLARGARAARRGAASPLRDGRAAPAAGAAAGAVPGSPAARGRRHGARLRRRADDRAVRAR